MDKDKIAKLLALLADPAASANERESAKKAIERLLAQQPTADADRWSDLTALARTAAEALAAGAVSGAERRLRERLAAWGQPAKAAKAANVTSKPVERMTRQELIDQIVVGGYPVDIEGLTADDDEQPAIVVVFTLPDDVADALSDRARDEAKIGTALGALFLDAITRGLTNESTWGDLPFDPDADAGADE